MMLAMRKMALRSELAARSARTRAARERARGRSDAVAWWYIRNVELLIGRPEVMEVLRGQAEAIASAEEARENGDRAEARRRVDRWVVEGFAKGRPARVVAL